MDKHSSLLRKTINYGRNKFYDTGPRWQHGSQPCFWNFYLVKNLKIAKNPTTAKARDKIIEDLESLEF
jgi:hypothetical protein